MGEAMNAIERRLQIFEKIKQEKTLEVNALSQMFHVTPMTIRRDLKKLEQQGILTTNYGGAVLNEGVSHEPSFGLKTGYSQQSKIEIAYEASKRIQNGDCIYIDCGTTTLELVRFLMNKEITVITNSWKVLSQIDNFSKMRLILLPGEYDPISEGTISSSTVSYVKNYTIDKAFLSTQGVDVDYGITVPSDNDAQVKSAIFAQAKERYLLVDHTKFQQRFLAKHGNLEEFDGVIVDSNLDHKIVEELKQKGIHVIVSPKIKKRTS
ncbi:MAG: DeoR/GlpR family DNA-binding transcription regulator [Erysipelotrichaceae bacterium]|nr:DeoR/GlpR family DNA-binding transcription regulator [Erysipelotrichaceae bacterium]